MHNVLTVVADPATRLLSASAVSTAHRALEGAGAQVVGPDWLAPSLACDLVFTHRRPERAEAAARAALEGLPLDIAVQPLEGRRKLLLVADMDSTIITAETLDEVAAYAGLKDEIATITAATMRGELPFEESLRLRVGKLGGLSVQVMGDVVRRLELSPGARTLVRTMRGHGAYTMLVSGGFTFASEPVAELCGFHEHRANVLLHRDGRVLGEVAEPIIGRHAKLETLRELCERLEIEPEAVCAVGDGANDLAMIEAAGLGVAYRGKPKVRAAARFRVDHGDLTALLYFQGYREAEFTA